MTWTYEQGIELRDPSMKEVADYSARLISWYMKGGFSDEFGKRHESGYHYSIPYWEVLNEIEFEHHINAETYTRLYDETVTAVKKVQPEMKFVGLALATTTDPHYFEYFLDPKNHKPGVPLDFISYHFYAVPTADQTPEVEQFTYFDQAEGFLKTVRYVDTMQDAAHRFCQFSCGVCEPCRRPKFCAGCSHRSLHTVNPQLANGLCFAVRNERPSLDEAEQTPYAAVKSGRNEDGTGMDLVGFTRKCQFCTAKLFCRRLAVLSDSRTGNTDARVGAQNRQLLATKSVEQNVSAAQSSLMLTDVRAALRMTRPAPSGLTDRSGSSDRRSRG